MKVGIKFIGLKGESDMGCQVCCLFCMMFWMVPMMLHGSLIGFLNGSMASPNIKVGDYICKIEENLG